MRLTYKLDKEVQGNKNGKRRRISCIRRRRKSKKRGQKSKKERSTYNHIFPFVLRFFSFQKGKKIENRVYLYIECLSDMGLSYTWSYTKRRMLRGEASLTEAATRRGEKGKGKREKGNSASIDSYFVIGSMYYVFLSVSCITESCVNV